MRRRLRGEAISSSRPEETMKAVSPWPVIFGIMGPIGDGLIAWIAPVADLTKETR